MHLSDLIQPIKAMRRRYLPLLAIYFAYGCSSFSGIGESFFVKEHLNLSAASLLMIGVWLSLPWNIKMVLGQLVDSLPLFRSRRKSYIFVAAGLMVIGSLMMAGLAGQWTWLMALASKNTIFVMASLLTVLGVVLQDVVADAMSVEVVERDNRAEEHINHDLAMVQLLGRLALSFGGFLVAGLGGWLAHVVSYQTLFLLTLIIPLISITGVLTARISLPTRQPISKKILIGGLFYAIFAVGIGLSDVPYGPDLVFIASLIIVIYLIRSVIGKADKSLVASIVVAAIIIFIFRAVPGAGPGAQWFMIDVLGFDKAFFGTLSQIGAGLSIIGMWLFAKWITQKPIRTILTWLTIVSFILGIPIIAMFYGLHEWTMQHFGFGARTIALVDTALASPFAQLSMIPMLALIARNAPAGNAATWFALMASLMNLALTAGTLFSRYLNQIFVVTREIRDHTGKILVHANYDQLGILLIVVSLIGLVVPLLVIWCLTYKKPI